MAPARAAQSSGPIAGSNPNRATEHPRLANLVQTSMSNGFQVGQTTKPIIGGGRNQAQITQRWNSNQSQTIQIGTRNQSQTLQRGTVNQSQTVQSGNRNQAQTVQTGGNNQSQTLQRGSGNQSQTVQNGSRNQAQTGQTDSRNKPQSGQLGTRNQSQTAKRESNTWHEGRIGCNGCQGEGRSNQWHADRKTSKPSSDAHGDRNVAWARMGNQYPMSQTRTGNQSQTVQTGSANQSQTVQAGSKNQSQTIQIGPGNQSQTIQTGKPPISTPPGPTKLANGPGPGNITTTSKTAGDRLLNGPGGKQPGSQVQSPGDPVKNPGKPGKTSDNTSATVTQQGSGNTSIIDQSKKNLISSVKQENKTIQNITPPAPPAGESSGPTINIQIGGDGPAQVEPAPVEEPVEPAPVIIERVREPVSTPQPAPAQDPSPAKLIAEGISDYSEGNYVAAEKRYKLALVLLQNSTLADPQLTAIALENLALVYEKLGKTQEGADASERAGKIRENA